MTTTNSTPHPVAPVILRTDHSEDSAARRALNDIADDRYHTHLLTVLSVSSGMVGVCLTAIGLIGIIKSLRRVDIFVDHLLAVGAVLFMVTALMSFLALRTRVCDSWRSFPRTLDAIFCLGLVQVVVATTLLTWVVV